MSSLGFQLVYSILGEKDDIVCERFFLPQHNESLLSVESGRPLRDFPFLFVSISFEHDYLNLVKLLLAGGVEPLAKIRREKEGRTSPLIICGGVATFMNPEPIAPFIDLFVLGEAEPVLGNLVDYLHTASSSSDINQLIPNAVKLYQGLYAPSLYRPVYNIRGQLSAMEAQAEIPQRVKRLRLENCRRAGHSQLLTPLAEFADLYLTELGRGCSRGCRFCAAGFIYRPPRLWDADAIVQGLAERSVDVKRIGLLGMEMAGDATLDQISRYLLDSGCALSFSSLRADKISDGLVELLSCSHLKSAAIAPDGASERLRSVINKGLTAHDLIRAAVRLVEAGIYKLKLYVMVGLPTETCEDLQELIDLIVSMKIEIDALGRKRGRLTEIYLSVNCFVPKPWTPFQYHPFGIQEKLNTGESRPLKAAVKNLKEKIAYLNKGLQPLANVHFQADKPENVIFQALLSRGDRRLAQVLYDMAVLQMSWKSSMRKNNLTVEQYILTGFDDDSFFPWYIIDHGIDHSYLWHEYLKGFLSAKTDPCDTSICRRCGVCGER